MSIVFSEKTRRTRLFTLAFLASDNAQRGTLLILLAVWWAVAAQQW
jgi:taurine transport system permease protein